MDLMTTIGGAFDGVRSSEVVATLVYSSLGLAMFLVAFLLFSFLMPFSVRKEIEEDQNTSLGIIIGAFLIGLALIVSKAIGG